MSEGFVGTDIFLKKSFLTQEETNHILQYFDSCIFEPMITEKLSYYAGAKNGEKYWVRSEDLIDRYLYDIVSRFLQEVALPLYPDLKHEITGDSGYRFNRYAVGHGYRQHVDQSYKKPEFRRRICSLVINLNNNYKGGCLYFPRQEVEIQLGEGDVLFFPAFFTHPHGVQPVESGVRKSVVLWYT